MNALSTIKSSREIDNVFRMGRRSATPLVVVLRAHTPAGRDPGGRLAFVAGKKIGNSVFRSRCKRVLRAAARSAGGPWPGSDVVLIARSSTASASSVDVAEAIRRAVSKMSPS